MGHMYIRKETLQRKRLPFQHQNFLAGIIAQEADIIDVYLYFLVSMAIAVSDCDYLFIT